MAPQLHRPGPPSAVLQGQLRLPPRQAERPGTPGESETMPGRGEEEGACL